MAKLYFYYSAMNAGKSTTLLQSAYNYNERGMATLIFAPQIDNRYGSNQVTSRIGLSAPAIAFHTETNLFKYVQHQLTMTPKLSCVLVDEAQFLSKTQVLQLTDIVDKMRLPVLAFGIRSDFQGDPFTGSQALLVWADNIVELKTICFCGKKAIMNSRIDGAGNIVRTGEQIAIGGNQEYMATCRYHFKTLTNIKDIE